MRGIFTDKFVLESIVGDLRIIFQGGFCENPAPISSHRSNSQIKFIGNFSQSFSRRNHAKDLQFPGRQVFMKSLVQIIFKTIDYFFSRPE